MTATDQGYDERVAALHNRADEPLPESWQPKNPGDELVGKFVRLDKGVTSYGDCWIVVLESLKQPGQLASVWLLHTALKSQFAKAKPKPDQLVLIRYEGKRKPKSGGAEYHDWKVLTEGGGQHGGFSWDEFAGAEPSVDPEPDFDNSEADSIPF